MPATGVRPGNGHASVFENVNRFIGHHAACSDVGEEVTCEVSLRASSGDCTVTITCVCGTRATFPAREAEGRELSTVTRMYNIPTVEERI